MKGNAARDVAALFKILASETRVTLLHALACEGELSVMNLAKTAGMKAQAVSNQLQRLVDRGILAQRREGTYIHYRLADPCIAELLDRGLCLMEDAEARRRRARVPTARTRGS